MKKYEKFDMLDVAAKGRNYVTSMVDEKYDYLPYWFIMINEAPAYAKHVRVDDAELVASWYEAIVYLQKILGKDERAQAVEKGLKKHLLNSWGPKGLRYHEPFPWTKTQHSSFHEMGYVLNALNVLQREEPGNTKAEQRAMDLVKGMRGLVLERKMHTFWSGDYPINEKTYEFPNDVYLQEGGWDMERLTGRGESSIRNGVILYPLAVRADEFKDPVALDLAVGTANYLLGLSRYFNWKGEYFGHVHSAVWVAGGLARLGRITGNEMYIKKANEIFRYTLSLSSEFGWVPEYAQWHPAGEEHCETCCIKDMIECGFELIDCGYDYWDIINKFTRNQLSEQQVKDGSFISVDNSKEDEDGHTWKNMDRRVVGGWSGGGEANSISLSRFRSIAGCCVGTAPQALHMVWDRIVRKDGGAVYVNLPMEKDDALALIEIGYPNDGFIKVTARSAADYLIRAFDWMGSRISVTVNGAARPLLYRDNCILIESVKVDDVIVISHPLEERVTTETVRDAEFTVTWHGPDVVKMDPPGLPLQLYQRELGMPKSYPAPVTAKGDAVTMAPSQQKK